MKKILITCSAVLLFCFPAGVATAATDYWDNNGTSAATSGTWDTTSTKWALSSTLTASTVTFTNGNYAIFAAGSTAIGTLTITVPGTVSCDGLGDASTSTGTASGASITNLTFSGAGSISLPSGTWPFECGNGGGPPTVTINVPITGAGGIIQHNNGSLGLEGINTYSGGTTLTGGQVINYYNNSSFGSGAISVTGSGNALVNASSSALSIPNNFSFPTANYQLNLQGGSAVAGVPGTTYSGTFTLPTSGQIGLETSASASSVTEISGVISGASGVVVSDSGALKLGGVNTYTGSTTISSPAILTIVGSGTLGSGSYSGLITNNSALVYNSSAAQTFSGVISGTGKLTNNGTAKLVLTAVNTCTGTNVVNGASGCALQLGDGASKSGTVAGAIVVTSPASLILAPGGSTITYNGTSQVISGNGAVTMNGPGTFIMGGNHNIYTGGTIINGGTLQTGGDSTSSGAGANLGASPASFQAANITLGGGTLQGNNPNFALAPNRGITLTANSGLSALIEGNTAIPGQGELGIQGAITDNSAGYGITITGQTNLVTGLLSGVYLEGVNTYTGPTVVKSGILSLYYSGSISPSSLLNIASGAAFDVSSNNASSWNLSQPLTANGSADGLPGLSTVAPTAAAIFVGANGGTVNFGSYALNLTITPTNFVGDGEQPALYVSQGAVVLNGNTVSVTNNGASPLGYGSYTLIQQAGGSMSAVSAPTLAGGTIYGNGLVAGATASLVVSGDALTLVVAPSDLSVPYFSNLSPAPLVGFTYGSATSITLSGTVSNLSGGIAMAGDVITAQVGNVAAQNATIGANGSFSISYTLPAYMSAGYYPIAYSYSGTLGSASDGSTALQITPALLSILSSNPSRNYNGSIAVPVSLAPSPLNGDTVTINGSVTPYGSTNFANPNPGATTVIVSGLYLTGAQAANYYLPSTYTLSATIYNPSFTWDGLDSVTNNNFQWNDQYNWTGDVAPDAIGDSIDFGGATGLVPVVQSSYTNWSLTFDSTAGAFVITNLGSGSGVLAIGAGGITNNSANVQTFALAVSSLTTYSAQWYVTNGGTLLMNSNVSDAGGGITLGGAGILSLAGSNNPVTGPFTNLAGTIEISGGAKLNGASYAGAIANNGTFVFNSTSNQTLSGVISGSGTFVHEGTGTLTLSGANTYTGPTIVSNGSLVISKDSNLGTAPATAVASQLVLNNNINNGVNNYGLRDTGGTFTLSPNRGIYLGPLGGSINIQSGFTLTVGGIVSGPGSFYASPNDSAGFGTIIFAANNTYQGATYIGAGTLELGISGALPAGTPLTINQTGSGNAAAAFNMNGFSQAIGPLQSGQFGGTGTVLPVIDLTGPLTVYQTNATTTFDGAITGSGGSLTIAVPVGGVPGTLILSGTNTYTGGTVINAGTLALAGTGFISNTPAIAVGSGATFDVSSKASFALTSNTLSGFGTVNGTVAVGSSAVIAPGNSTTIGALNVTGSILLQGGGTNIVKVQSANTGAGVGNDTVTASANLTMQATSGNPYTIKLVSVDGTGAPGSVSDFANTNAYAWTIAAGTVNNFNAASFVVDTSSFANSLGGGQFFVSSTGGSLVLLFKPAGGSAQGVGASIGAPSFNGTGNPTFSGSGIPGYTYGVESATSLLGPWIEAGTAATAGDGTWTFTDPNQTNPPTIFYRLYYPDDPGNPPQ